MTHTLTHDETTVHSHMHRMHTAQESQSTQTTVTAPEEYTVTGTAVRTRHVTHVDSLSHTALTAPRFAFAHTKEQGDNSRTPPAYHCQN